MLISVSFPQLEQHQDILRQESRIVSKMEDLLNQLYRKALEDSLEDADYFRRNLQFIKEEAHRISQRKELLENTRIILSQADNELRAKISEMKVLLRGIN